MQSNSILLNTLDDSFNDLSPQAKADIITGLIRRYVRDKTDGVTAPEIARDLNLAHTTVKKHLNYLVSTRQLYTKTYSPRNVVYFPNGRLSHPYQQLNIDLKNRRFRVSLIENPKGEFIYLQELENIRSMGERVIGGVIIRKENIDEVLQAVHNILENVKVLEYGNLVSAPFCAKILGDLGAEVIKIEKPIQGDKSRRSRPFLSNIPGSERSGLFLYLNTNKLGITLNLETVTGIDILTQLIRNTDVIVENSPPKIMEELGIKKAFTFDSHFAHLGFEVYPGI